MEKALIQAFLEAFAVGDAYGKVTEYCSQKEIRDAYDHITELLPPEKSIAHDDLFYGQVTDDTEQTVYLIDAYARAGRVTAYDTAMCLLRWVQETDAAQKYIGPNSLRALQAIKRGEDVASAGLNGTTCGGMMRSPAAFLFSDERTLERNVVNCLMPTHNTSVALEAAMCYACALQAAAEGLPMERILVRACQGAEIGKQYGSHKRVAGVAPSCSARIRYLWRLTSQWKDEAELQTFLYEVIGATLASCDVCACVFALFMYCGRDVARAVRMATELGGDTDTIACLAAGLCTLYAGGHNLPRETVELVAGANHLDFAALADKVLAGQAAMKEA